MHRLTICLLVGIFVLATIWSAEGLSCLRCAEYDCQPLPPSTCQWGVGKDPCGCCDVCLKGPGEVCGGPWNTSGWCGEGLTCIEEKPDDFNSVGVCKKKT